MAAIKGLDAGSASRLIQTPPAHAVQGHAPQDMNAAFPSTCDCCKTPISASNSDFFEVTGRLRLSDRVLTERSLVQRLANRQINVLNRERVASLEQVGS